jgi:predicted glutamine amidotransferase
MCGICGIRRFGPEPINAEQIKVLLIGNERRGNQATGVALQQADGSVQVFKTDDPANAFVILPEFNAFLEENLRKDTLTVLGHTRAATKGHPSKNQNNHPMWDGKVALVHNGMVNNDDFLFGDLKLERSAETDSDIFRAILSSAGFTTKGTNLLNRVVGSAAIAAVSTEYPGKLFLARSGNPIVIASTSSDGNSGHMVWSSEKQPIYDSMRPWAKKPPGYWFRKARADYYFTNFPNETSWLIGDKPIDTVEGETWIEWHAAFKTSNYFRNISYDVHSNYALKRGVKKIRLVVCPNPKCFETIRGKEVRTTLQVSEAQQEAGLEKLHCPDCKTPLRAKAGE